MTQPTTAPAATPSLAFAPSVNARRQEEIATFLASYARGERPRAQCITTHVTRIIGRTPNGPVIRFVLFSEGVKRDGDEFLVAGAQLENLRANPRVMFSHKYERLPVGNWLRVEKVEDARLGSIIEADAAPLRIDDGSETAEFSKTIFRMYEAHDLDAVSGGWIPLNIEPRRDGEGRTLGVRHLESDVLEGSAVAIPSDTMAVQRSIQAGRLPERHIEMFVRHAGASIYTIRDALEVSVPDSAVPDPAAPTEVAAAIEKLMESVPAKMTAAIGREIAAIDVETRPYKVEAEHAQCSASKPWGVVKADSGELMGCHETEEKAKAQVGALYANESVATADAERGEPDLVPAAECRVVPGMDEAKAAYAAMNDAFGDVQKVMDGAGADKLSDADMQTIAKACDTLEEMAGDMGDAMDMMGGDMRAAAGEARWNRQLSRAFDVAAVALPAASGELDLIARYLECDVRDICQNGTFIASVRIGVFLTALDEQLAARWQVQDLRRFDYGPRGETAQAPPVYEVMDLNSKLRAEFLINGTRFLLSSDGRLVVELHPAWGGLSLRTYSRLAERQLGSQLVDVTWERARQLNFLQGEAFALSGEFLTRTDETWADVFLESENETPVRRVVDLVNRKGAGLTNRGLLLLGPPGTGKTLVGRVVMNEARATFIWVSARDFHYSGAFGGLTDAFDLARECAPSVLFIEDVDNWLSSTAIDLLKTEMDGIGRSTGVVTVLTTNYPERLPDALIDRPGRFHDVLKFDLPSETARTRMLERWLPELTATQRQQAVDATAKYSGAHLRELAHFVGVLREEDQMDLGEALTLALTKLREQRELIAATHLASARFSPSMATRQGFMQARRARTPHASAARATGAHPSIDAEQLRVAITKAMAGLPLLRKGAVLSQKNKDKISQAIGMMDEAMMKLKGVMADAMKEMDAGEEMPAGETATVILAATREPELVIPLATEPATDDLDDIRARLEDLERNAPKQRRRYDDLLRETTRGQAAASRLRDKATRLGTSAPEK